MAYEYEHLRYCDEKFAVGVDIMARSPASLRQRIHDAYMQFHPAFLFDKTLPAKIAGELRGLHARLTWNGGILGTLRTISDAEALRLACAICDLAVGIEAALRDADRARATTATTVDAVDAVEGVG